MEKLLNWLSLAIGIVGGVICKMLGGLDGVLIALIVAVVLDYATGVIKAIYYKRLSSEIGFHGLLKKALIFLVVALAVVVQGVISEQIPLREVTVMFYLANEGISILENAAEFVPLPERLKEVLLQIRDGGKKAAAEKEEVK